MENSAPLPAGTRRNPLSLRAKLVIGFTLLSALVSFLTARGMYTNLEDQVNEEFDARAANIAGLASLQQNGDEFVQIASRQDTLYEKFLAQNRRILASDPDITRVFTLRKNERGIFYVVDAVSQGEGSLAAFNELLDNPPSVLADNFDTLQKPVVETATRTGTMGPVLSAYAPILNSQGQNVGVIGVDVSAAALLEKQRAIFDQSVLVFLIALGLGIFFGYVTGNTLTEPIVRLTKGASDFASGNLEQRVAIDTRDEIGVLANTFNTMAGEIQGLISGLEQRVSERTQDLANRSAELETANRRIQSRASQFEALAQVAQTITSVRDLQELLPLITRVISEKFNFYHVGIFLLDEVGQYAVLSAANSEGGRRMLERKHRLRVGEEGIVGYATYTGKPRIAMDVGQDAVFFNNPDLPGTHSEMALPLVSQNVIVGALDVQSTEVGAFTDEDVQMLSLLADQVGLAIENARLFDETRRALGESEAISRQITREAFGRLAVEQNLIGYRYNITGAKPLEAPVEVAVAAGGGTKPKQTGSGQVMVPIELRGETIGVLAVESPSLHSLNQDQIDMIRAVAERVALAAENARLFDETARRAERERMVSDITSKIRSVNDPDAMIKTALEELRHALGASRVDVIPQVVKGRE